MYKILLVDDEKLILRGLKSMIQSMDLGFGDIELAYNGEQAIEKLKTFAPQIIITDIKMPVMNGLEMIQQIRENHEELKDIKIIVLSGYQEFGFAVEAMKYGVIDYLLKPLDEEELLRLLSSTKEKLEEELRQDESGAKNDSRWNYMRNFQKQKQFMDIFNHKNINSQEVAISLNEFGIILPYENLLIICMELEHNGLNMAQELDGWYEYVIGNLRQVILESRQQNNLIFFPFYVENKFILLLSLNEKYIGYNTVQPLKKTLEDLIARVSRRFEYPLYIGISELFSRLEDIGCAYKQSCHALRYKLLKNGNYILFYSDISSLKKEGPLFLKEQQAIISGLEQNKNNIALKQFEFIKQTVKSLENPSIDYIENVYRSLFIKVLSHYSVTYPEIIKLVDISQVDGLIKNSCSIDELHGSIRKVVLSMHDYISGMNVNENEVSKRLIKKAIKYIQGNYGSEISLDRLADHLSIGSTYFSMLFKRETGMKFSEYVTRIRVEKAKDILGNSNKSITEIGYEVGYTSEKHFFAVFKKYTGSTPAKYREKLQ